MDTSTSPRLLDTVLALLTGFAVVLLAATLVTTGPERGTSVELISGAALLLPLGAATSLVLRRWFMGTLSHAHLLTVPLVTTAVFAMSAALLVSSGRDTSAVAMLALTTGAVAGMATWRPTPIRLLLLSAGGLIGFAAFTAFGSAAIIAVGAVVTLLAAAAVTVSSALDSGPTEDEQIPETRELLDVRG